MRRALTKVTKLTALAAAVAIAACLGPRADPSTYFLLSPVPPPVPEPPLAVTVGLGPITVPGYLDRLQIVTRLGENELAVSEVERWAEPLADNVRRTLAENLSAMLPGSSYVDFPWFPSEAPDLAVALDIRRFEADSAGVAVLDVTWRLSRAGTLVDGGGAHIQEPAATPGRAAVVAAQSRALGGLSAEIAAALRRAQGGG
jgi:uncharacterized lipoprotein YmbA